MVHAFFMKCKCYCGCGHECDNYYGPYFKKSVRKDGKVTSVYLGTIGDAAAEISGHRSGKKFDKTVSELISKALDAARELERKGCKITNPLEKGSHMETVHGRHAGRKSRKIDPAEKKFFAELKRRKKPFIFKIFK